MIELAPVERGFVNLRGNSDDGRFAAAIEAVRGVGLPNANASLSTADGIRTYWLGPDEWLIGCERAQSAAVAMQLESALAGQAAAINDVSGGYVLVTVPASEAPELLARGCTLDLHPARFVPGDCAQTMLAKANVLLAYTDDAAVYEIIVRRSFSEYLLRWLRQTRLSLAGSASSS